MKEKILVIVPAYNEAEVIKKTVDNLKSIKNNNLQFDYLVINDGSTDDTLGVLINNNIPHINLINNLGIGGCVQTGYQYALLNNYDIAIQFDGDNQHDARDISTIIETIKSADMVVGSRFVGGENEFKSSTTRRIGIKLLSLLIKLTTGVKINDVTSGYRAVNKEIIARFANHYPSDYPEPETIAEVLLCGYKVKEVPVRMHQRKTGKSSIAPLKGIYYMIKVGLSIILVKLTHKKGAKNAN